jgi:hypothetical protein
MDSTAAGVDGIPPGLYKPYLPPCPAATNDQPEPSQAPQPDCQLASGMIAQHLQLVFECIHAAGHVPAQWHYALLVPIHKKGDMHDLNNYRPLSVPTVACRLWSSVLNHQLMQQTSSILPDEMFGFRPGRSCSDLLFIMRHLADLQRGQQGGKFAVAFMDLSGAYDSVDRDLLFHKLHNLGMSDRSLGLLRSLYQATQCIAKCDQGTSQPFTVGCGLRQGCPLSTTLFNLFIWDLHKRITTECKGCGVPAPPHITLGPQQRDNDGSKLSDFYYADDCSLLGSTPQELQRIVDCFCTYCNEHGLIINPTKCEVVVFASKRAWPRATWTAAGKPLARVDSFKYLGVELYGSKSIRSTLQHRLGCMVKAQSCINRRLHQLHIERDPLLTADLFDIITSAAGSYGCEVWCTHFLSADWLSGCSLQSYQATTYKRCLGVKRSSSSLATYFECGRYPIQVHWLYRTVKYWNKLVKRAADSDLLDRVLHANIQAGITTGRVSHNWASELMQGLHHVMPDTPWRAHMQQQLPIDANAVRAAAQHKFENSLNAYNQDPALPSCTHRHHNCYHNWMHIPQQHSKLTAPQYLYAEGKAAHKQAAARVRLCNAPTRVNTDHQLDYNSRSCTRCNRGPVDHELHYLLKCPVFTDIRRRHTSLFRGRSRSVNGFMSCAYDPSHAAEFSSCMFDFENRVMELNAPHQHRL